MEGRRGLFAAPMALLLWISTRRMRKEAAAAMEQAFRALMEQFALLLEEYRAGKLSAQNATEVEDPLRKAEWLAAGAIGDNAPLRSSAVAIPDRGERRRPQRPRVRTKERAAKVAQPPASRTPSVCFAARPPQSGERARTVANWRPLDGVANRASRILDRLRCGPRCAHMVTIS